MCYSFLFKSFVEYCLKIKGAVCIKLIAVSLFAKTSKESDTCLKSTYSMIDFLQCMDRENERLEQLILKRVKKLKAYIPKERNNEVESMNSA